MLRDDPAAVEESQAPQEVAAAPAQAIVVLPPAKRAELALKSETAEKGLRALMAKSADIKAVANADGREQVHRMAMDLKNARCAIANAGEDARADATAFSKAVVAEVKRLAEISKPEEDRVFALRDGFDAKVKAEKEEAARIEAERVSAIKAKIAEIQELPAGLVGASSDVIATALHALANREITKDEFAELTDQAQLVVDATGEVLVGMRDRALERERAEAERVRLLAEEQARIEAAAEANRVEAARLAEEARIAREAQAERDRIAAAERAEQQRVAAEAKRQLDAQAAAVEAQRHEQARAVAAMEAEREKDRKALAAIKTIGAISGETGDARALMDALERVTAIPEYDGAMGEMVSTSREVAMLGIKHKIESALAIEIPLAHAEAMEIEMDSAHGEALEENAKFDEARSLVEVFAPRSVEMAYDLPIFQRPQKRERESDKDIAKMVAERFDYTYSGAIVRLAEISIKALEESDE